MKKLVRQMSTLQMKLVWTFILLAGVGFFLLDPANIERFIILLAQRVASGLTLWRCLRV